VHLAIGKLIRVDGLAGTYLELYFAELKPVCSFVESNIEDETSGQL
jgi:hypothetical protein